MKIFIKNISVFFILALATLLAVVLIPNEITKTYADFRINKNSTHVVFGHSHPSYAYNDSLISNFQNLADAGESYFYTYQKVKNIIPNNPQIQTVFVEFTNNQIDIKMDDWIWGFEKMSYFLPIYAPYIEKDDFQLLYEKNSQNLTACLSIAAKKNIVRSVKKDFTVINSIAGYKWGDMNNAEEMIEQAKSDTSDYATNYKISITNLEYLKKIIDFCRTHKKEVFLIRSPQHRALADLKNEIHYQTIKNDMFNDVTLLDFNSFTVPNDHYIDLDHLNYKGAKLFSIMINDLINNNLLNNTNKTEQIKEAIVSYKHNQTKSLD